MVKLNVTGKNPTDAYLEEMMNEAPGPINFTMFLTMFGEKLNGTDPEDVIKNAFACFDEDNSGKDLLLLVAASVLLLVVIHTNRELQKTSQCCSTQCKNIHIINNNDRNKITFNIHAVQLYICIEFDQQL